jgi:ankyrin repeat protein
MGIRLEQIQKVKELLALGANPNGYVGGDSMTPVMFAAMHGNAEIINVLLDAGANNINYEQDPGLDALHYALDYGSGSAAECLIRRGAVPREDTLLIASKKCEPSTVSRLLAIPGVNFHIDPTILHQLACRASTDLYAETEKELFLVDMNLIIERGVNIDHLNHQSRTPLWSACVRYLEVDDSPNRSRSLLAIKFLLGKDAKLDDIVDPGDRAKVQEVIKLCFTAA